jgi:hypothetical protein
VTAERFKKFLDLFPGELHIWLIPLLKEFPLPTGERIKVRGDTDIKY